MQCKIEYVNEIKKKEGVSGLGFIALVSLGFICAVGVLCFILWVMV